jgi:hypothetical protein
MTAGSGCSLLEDYLPWDSLVKTAVSGGRLEDPREDVVAVPYDRGVGILHRFMSPMIVVASSINWPRSSLASCTPTSLG